MSNTYVENDNGFFVKATLFKDDVNGRKWRSPFNEDFYKGISRSFGKIPYIDIIGKTPDEHQEKENDLYIEQLQKDGLSDTDIMAKLHDRYSKPHMGAVGVVVDMYDVEKKATYGNVLNTCALSMGMCEKSDPEVAVLDFIIKITNDEYKEKIRKGEVKITPSPSLYAAYIKDNDVDVVNVNDFFDMIHVANASIPANGKHAIQKAFCEGDLGSCKKKMLNAALPVVENINNSITEDTPRMSEQTPNPASAPAANAGTEVPTSGFNVEDFQKVLASYNVPKDLLDGLEKINNEIKTVKETNESTQKELNELKAQAEARQIEARKALITKHIDPEKVFKGDTEAFTKKIEWINKMKFSDEDLAVYLNEAYPVKVEAEKKKEEIKDQPEGKAVYGGMPNLDFNADDFLKTLPNNTENKEGTVAGKRTIGWGSTIPLSASEY